jgi:hypothetical protein
MRALTRKTRFVGSALFFGAMTLMWAIGAPLAWACPDCPAPPLCLSGPGQLCKTVETCTGNTCTTDYYYYT